MAAFALYVLRVSYWLQLPPSKLLALLKGGEKTLNEEWHSRDLWEDGIQRNMVIESFKADCDVRSGRPPGY